MLDYEQPTEFLVRNRDYDNSYKTPVLTAGKTFLLGYTNELTGIFIDKLPAIIFDDFTTAFKYVDFPFKAKSSAMKILIPKSKCVNMKFVYEAMQRVRFPLGEHKRYWISEYQRERISYPSKDEQQKIANFLSSVDTKIEQLGKKKALLKQYKKGIMQKLFSQEIRFKDEQGNDYLDWEGNTLGMLFEISAGGDIENSHSRKNKDGIFRYPIYANSEKEKGLHGYSDRYSVKQNCITVSGRGTLGVAHARFEKFFPIVRLLVLIPRKESNLIFFKHAINLLQIFKESTGVPQLTAPQLKKYHLNYPSIKEQQKIANFLSAIDKKIELVAEQLEQARTYKKGLLQQMFI